MLTSDKKATRYQYCCISHAQTTEQICDILLNTHGVKLEIRLGRFKPYLGGFKPLTSLTTQHVVYA